MKPRSSSTLVFSRPIFSVFGLRPTATSSFSASRTSCLPSLVGQRELDAFAGLLDVLGARAGLDADLLLLEVALQFLRDVLVFHRHDARQHFDDRHVRAEALEDRRELDAHRARADDRQALGDGGEIQDLDVGQDELGVGLQAGKHAGLGAGRDDDVLCLQRLDAGIGLDFHLAAALEGGEARDALDLGALQQEFDAFGVLGDDPVLALLHFGIVEARVFAVDAVLVGVFEMLPDIGGVEQGLGGNAAHQEAGPAEFGLLFDERGLESVLAGADGCGVAAGTTPDHYQIVRHFFYSTYVTGAEAGASTFIDEKAATNCDAGLRVRIRTDRRQDGARNRRPARRRRFPIASITIEGNRNFTREQILAISKLRVGEMASKADFEAARDRLVACGAFETVSYRYVACREGRRNGGNASR